jgi:hypothetical protein
MGAFTPQFRLSVLWNYLLGGSAVLFAVSLFGSCVYAGAFDNWNKWIKYTYGRHQVVHRLAICIAVFAVIAACFVLSALFINLFFPSLRKIELILWGVGLILTFLVISLESAGVEYTKYGNFPVCDQWEYYKDDDFKSYVDTYSTPEWQPFNYWPDPLPVTQINLLKKQVQPEGYEDVPGFSELFADTGAYVNGLQPDYPTIYRVCKPPPKPDDTAGEKFYRIPSCIFNWTSMVFQKKLTGGDPCRYHIADEDAVDCIGDWTGSRFRDYWCEDYGRAVDLGHYMAEDGGRTEVDRIKYVSSWVRSERGVTTLAAFYRHNTYLLYMQLCGLIVTCIVLYFEHFHGAAAAAAKDGEAVVEA